MQKIKKNEMFKYKCEFMFWLKETYDFHFQSISFTKLKGFFKYFLKEWNSKQLPVKYYDGTFDLSTTKVDWNLKLDKEMIPKTNEGKLARMDIDPDRKRIESLAEKKRVNRFLKEKQLDLDEIVPRKEGKALQREKRKHKQAEDDQEEYDEYDADEDEFQKLLKAKQEQEKRSKERQDLYESQQKAKLELYRDKERNLVNNFI